MYYLKPLACIIFMLIVAGILAVSLPGVAIQSAGDQDLKRADELFRRGQFNEAAQLYAQVAKKNPDSYGAAIGLGRIFVLRNSLDNAETWVKKAMALKPGEKEPKALMGEILYRQDKYFQAAPYFEAIGQDAKAEKLSAFKDKAPFLIERGPEVTTLPFIQTDPLPIIELTVNGQKGMFLIDTGAWELHIMPAFAEKCRIKPLTQKQVGIFAGGRQAASGNGVADTVFLGDFSVRNVPVVLPEAPQGPFSIDGIVGTVVLYHFKFTLDYPAGKLILRRFPPAISKKPITEPEPEGAARTRFWLLGDHLIFARGTVNGIGPYLFLVDTGMAGGGFDCPKSVIDEARIELSREGLQGMGGGGAITVYPITVNLTLGAARRDNVRGLYGAIPPDFEYRNGFRMGGLISHGFFRPFVVTFDFKTMTLAMKQDSSADSLE